LLKWNQVLVFFYIWQNLAGESGDLHFSLYDFPGGGDRIRKIPVLQDLRTAEAAEEGGFHGLCAIAPSGECAVEKRQAHAQFSTFNPSTRTPGACG